MGRVFSGDLYGGGSSKGPWILLKGSLRWFLQDFREFYGAVSGPCLKGACGVQTLNPKPHSSKKSKPCLGFRDPLRGLEVSGCWTSFLGPAGSFKEGLGFRLGFRV